MKPASSLKLLLRRTAESVAAFAAPLSWRFCGRGTLLVLMYHRVLPRGSDAWNAEQPGMCVSPETLDMHLGVLGRYFQFVHLDDWVATRQAGAPLPRRACAITFDDGWRDNYDWAFPVLRKYSVPATVFLVSDLVGSSYKFWPNRLFATLGALRSESDINRLPVPLAGLVHAASGERLELPLTVDQKDAIIEACKGRFSDAEMDSLMEGPGQHGATRSLLDWDEIAEMANSGLVRFGSHGRRHTRLVEGLATDVLVDEVHGSRTELERRLGMPITIFCYPNGDSGAAANHEVRSGYAAAVLTRSGWNGTRSDLWQLKRVGVHEDAAGSPQAFLGRLAGLP